MKINPSVSTLNTQDGKLLQKCNELEANFWQIMLEELAKTATSSQEEAANKDYFKDMFYTEVAQELAKSSGSGLAKAIYDQYKMDTAKQLNSAEEKNVS